MGEGTTRQLSGAGEIQALVLIEGFIQGIHAIFF
jgi:hypothetical protein